MAPLDGEKMLKKMVQGKRMFVVLAGFVAALLGVGLASADIRGGVADTLGDYYQARAGMAPVEAEVEHPIPAGETQLGGLEAEDPADDEVEAKLEDDPEDEAEEQVEGAEGDQDDETQADTDDDQTDGDDDTDDDTKDDETNADDVEAEHDKDDDGEEQENDD